MPHFIGVQGNLGAGKTTLATILAHLYKNQIESKYGGHIDLFSNCNLSGSTPMKESEDWFKVAQAHGSICVWDEAHRAFDSRRAMSFHNQLATDILTFCRKMVSIQIFVTPSVKRLDSRIREMLEVLIHVRKIGNKGISFEYFDYQAEGYGPWGKFVNKRFLPQSKVKQIHKLELFDSHSFVHGFPLPKTEKQAITFMAELEHVHDAARHSHKNKSKEVVAS